LINQFLKGGLMPYKNSNFTDSNPSIKSGINPDCYGCLINQAQSTAKHAALSPSQTQLLLDSTLQTILNAHNRPMLVQHIVRHVADVTQDLLHKNNCDIYGTSKQNSHEIALTFVDDFQKQIEASQSPLEIGIRIAAAGNIIDFGAKDHASLDLNAELNSLNQLSFGHYDAKPFFSRLKNARNLLYICDNAGEIVFDKMLMGLLKQNYSKLEIIAALRHYPIINDATVDDALYAGLDEFATVISSGSIYPGTILDECSSEFIKLYKNADLIISKGQGNFETLLPIADERIFFLLRIKCDTMAKLAGQKKGDLVFLQGKIK
jgi:uncharacterized protein with ATP-grasp and redox domains